MTLAVRGLQKPRQKARVQHYMFLIDFQKGYDSVDRSLLSQVLTRFGVPPRIIARIRQFQDGMRACVRNYSAIFSEEFDVEQGLR